MNWIEVVGDGDHDGEAPISGSQRSAMRPASLMMESPTSIPEGRRRGARAPAVASLLYDPDHFADAIRRVPPGTTA